MAVRFSSEFYEEPPALLKLENDLTLEGGASDKRQESLSKVFDGVLDTTKLSDRIEGSNVGIVATLKVSSISSSSWESSNFTMSGFHKCGSGKLSLSSSPKLLMVR
jgi:hypothetical protein